MTTMPPAVASQPHLRIASPKSSPRRQFPRSNSTPEGALRRQVLRPKPLAIPPVVEGGSAARSPTDRDAQSFRESSDQRSPTDRDARSHSDSWKELRRKGKKIDRTQRVITEIQINVNGDDKVYYCFGIDEAENDEEGEGEKVAVPAEVVEASIEAHGSIEKLRKELHERRELLKARLTAVDRPSALAGVMVADQSVLEYFQQAESALTQEEGTRGTGRVEGRNGGSVSLAAWGKADASVSLAGWGQMAPGSGRGSSRPGPLPVPGSGSNSPARWLDGGSAAGSPAHHSLLGSGANSPACWALPPSGASSPAHASLFAPECSSPASCVQAGAGEARAINRENSMRASSRLGPAVPVGEAPQEWEVGNRHLERPCTALLQPSPSLESVSDWSLPSSSANQRFPPGLLHAESRDSFFFSETGTEEGMFGAFSCKGPPQSPGAESRSSMGRSNRQNSFPQGFMFAASPVHSFSAAGHADSDSLKSRSTSDMPAADLSVLAYFEQKEATLSADNLAIEGFGSVRGTDPDVLEYFMRKAVLFSEEDLGEQALSQSPIRSPENLRGMEVNTDT